MLKLYDYYRSSASFRVRIALNLKKISYQKIPIHLVKNGGEQYSPEYKEINPQSLVPALQDTDKIITQSLAIIEYLDELYPSPSLLPKDPFQKAWVRSCALSIAADIHPLNNLRVLNYLTNTLAISDEQKNKWYQHWITEGLSSLEKKLIASSFTGTYCFGDTITLADVVLIPQMYNARRFACDMSAYPTLTRIDSHCQTVDAFKLAWPEKEMA